jgi:WD40 repeat protein
MPGLGDYASVTLAGHKADVLAVQVSRDGERVVSGSRDGTVRVWRLPPLAAVAATNVGAPCVVDLCVATPGNVEDRVYALALTAGATTALAGMLHGSTHVINCDLGRVMTPLQTERTAGAAVMCLALVEFNSVSNMWSGGVCRRLFAGHSTGVVSEWCLQSGSCVTVYGDARSGSGPVWSIAARVVPAAGGLEEQGSEMWAAVGSVVGVNRGGRSEGARGGECVIEFAVGHHNGTGRVRWTGACADDGGEKATRNANLLVLTDPAAGFTSTPKRHVDISGDIPSCVSASADGQWLVSGSDEGIVCVWDIDSHGCVATLLGHQARVVCVDITDSGAVVASCAWDTVRIWRLEAGAWSRPLVLQHQDGVSCVLLSADGSRAITGGSSGVLRVWDAETGVLREPVLLGHTADISSLAECGLAGNIDGGWRGCDEGLDVGACNLERPRSRSPRASLRFASRDKTGKCFLWSWPSATPVKSSFHVILAQPLQHVFLGELDTTKARRWHEQRSCIPKLFLLRDSTDAYLPGCRIYLNGVMRRELFVVPYASKPDVCTCFARVQLGSTVEDSSLFAFERHEEGVGKTMVCCGLFDGTLGLFELRR